MLDQRYVESSPSRLLQRRRQELHAVAVDVQPALTEELVELESVNLLGHLDNLSVGVSL